MAVVKANYVKRGKMGNARIKAHIRYIEHRRGKESAKITRALFGNDGALTRLDAYRMIDEAEKGTIFFRFVISPDPKLEDAQGDLDMREITLKTMQILNDKFHKPVYWVASLHADHTEHRHVHVVATAHGALNTSDLQLLRQRASEACLEQRRELDLVSEQRERKARVRKETWEQEV